MKTSAFLAVPALGLGAHAVLGLHQGCVSLPRGAPKVAKRPLGDGDRMPGFQGEVETAWGKKRLEGTGGWCHDPDPSAFLTFPAHGLGGSWGPWLSPRVRVSPTGVGSPKWQEGPQGTGTGCQAFKRTFKSPGKKWRGRREGLGYPLEASAFQAALASCLGGSWDP